MRKSKKSAVVKSNQSESLSRRLSSYVLAASATGVAMLSASIPAEARIINEQINFPLYGNQTYDFNPAREGVTPFFFVGTFLWHSSLTFWNRAFFQPNSAGASAVVSAGGLPAELGSGALIGPSQNWGKGASYGMLFTYGPYGGGTRNDHRGNFGKSGFVGFRFSFSGKQYYGWVRLKFSVHVGPDGTKETTTQIVNCAFESIPGKAIRAGQTKDTNEAMSNLQQTDYARETRAGALRGSLGALALGAQGLALDLYYTH